MKKALILTDCSVDLALSVNQWMTNQSETIDLTIVHAFALSLDENQPLTATAHHAAKQQAHKDLKQWLNYLSTSWPGTIQVETLLGEPELVMRIHLVLRQYDYLLIDAGQQEVASAFVACKKYISTELHRLNVPENAMLIPVPSQAVL